MTALNSLPPEFARRRVIGTADAAVFCGVSVSTFRRLREAGSIPAPIRLSQRKLGWRIGDLSDFLDCREQGFEWHEFQASKAGNDNRQRSQPPV